MNTGMQDAFNLAWKLALVVRKTCDEHLLDSYSPERSAVGDEVLKFAARLTALGITKNPIAQAVRNLVGHVMLGLSPVQHAFASNITEVTIGYPKSPLNGNSLGGAGPKAGERVAPIAGQVPVGSGGKPLFALFAKNTVATDELVERFEGLLDPNVRPPLHDGGVWLVRPDGYVACSSKDADVVASYLDQLVKPIPAITAYNRSQRYGARRLRRLRVEVECRSGGYLHALQISSRALSPENRSHPLERR